MTSVNPPLQCNKFETKKVFIPSTVSNELMREHYSLARYMAAEKRSRKEVFSLISSKLCRTDRKELRIQAANYNLCGVIFLFSNGMFLGVFFSPRKFL